MKRYRIKKDELAEIVQNEIPESKQEIEKLTQKDNVAGIVQILANLLKDLVRSKSWIRVKWVLMFTGWLYDRGENYIKDIIENIFVRALGSVNKMCTAREWGYIKQSTPVRIYRIYLSMNKMISYQ